MTRESATWNDAQAVSTFASAKHIVGLLSPPPDASAADQRAYHLKAAEVYRRVAETDHDHRYEARGYADAELIYAERIGRKTAS